MDETHLYELAKITMEGLGGLLGLFLVICLFNGWPTLFRRVTYSRPCDNCPFQGKDK